MNLICGNCLDELKKLDDESIDCIITDPPYNIGFADWDKFENIEQITAEWFRILKKDGSIFCFSGWSFVTTLISKFDKRLKLNDWIIYDRMIGRS